VPSSGKQVRVHDRHVHKLVETLELAQDQGAVRPRARVRDVEVVPSWDGG
jgi:hypothetical protein